MAMFYSVVIIMIAAGDGGFRTDANAEKFRFEKELTMNDATKTRTREEHPLACRDSFVEASGIPVRVPGTKTDPPAAPKQRPKKPVKKGGLLNTQEAAVFLGLQPSTLRTWRCTKAVDLKHVRIGSAVRYRESDLNDFIETHLEGGER